MTEKTIKYLECKLEQDFSPEQIAERMKLDPDWKGPTVSHERIYRHIRQDKAAGGKLYKHLRIAGHKKKRKRYRSKDSRGKIPNRVGIEHRPKLVVSLSNPIVETKKRIGDWEADTIIGKNHKGAMVTLVERKSKLTAIGKLARNTAEAVQEQIVRLFLSHKSRPSGTGGINPEYTPSLRTTAESLPIMKPLRKNSKLMFILPGRIIHGNGA